MDEPIIETKTQPPVKKTSKKSSMLTAPIVAQPASSTLDDSIVQEDERLVSTDSRYFPQGGRYIDRVNDVLLRNDIKFDINDANRRAGFFTDSRAGFALQDNPYALNAPNRVSIKSREVKSPSATDFKYYDTKDILFFKQLAESSPENSMLMSAYQWMIYPRTSIEEIDTVNQMYNRTKAAIAVNAKNQSEAGIVMNNIMQQIQDYTKDTPYQSVRKLASKYMDNLKQGRVEPRSQEELRKDFNDLASLRKFGLNEDQSMREYAGKMLMRGMDQSQSFVTQGADKRQQNINLFHEKLSPLPIGIANSQWKHGNMEIINKISYQPIKKTHLLYINFNINTNIRKRQPIYNLFKKKKLGTFQQNQPFEEYLKILKSHKFCLVPPGNGIDCHRTWECLYLGVIPIVEKHPHNTQLAKHLPILVVEDWNIITEEYLNNYYKLHLFKPEEQMFLRYYKKKLC